MIVNHHLELLSLAGVALGPLARCLLRAGLVAQPVVRNSRVERVLRVRLAQERLDRQKRRLDVERGRPVLLQNVEADSPDFVDVRVVYLCEESDLGRLKRVILGEEELELEEPAGVRAVGRALEQDVEVAVVVLAGAARDAWRRVLVEASGLAENSRFSVHGSVFVIVMHSISCDLSLTQNFDMAYSLKVTRV